VNLENLPRTAAEGVLDTLRDGSGYLRRLQYSFSIREDDVFVPTNLIQKYGLTGGYMIRGESVLSPKKKTHPVLVSVETVEGLAPDDPLLKPSLPFRDLTSLDPVEKFDIAHNTSDPSLRLMDLLAPIGKGQRGIIVAPPRTGKTMLMQGIANSIVRNHPEVHLIVVLVDERPEEATEWKRSVKRGEVLTSTSDESAANHVSIAEIAIERAKRLVEMKKDVVVLLDSLTRLARAYNLETKNSGRTLSGGIDVKTLAKPRGFFGSARNVEEGGSLTVIATALIDTGSRMDQVIFEEFKGTGNMELVLSRKLADLRIFPAFDLGLTGTRKEEKLIPENLLSSVWALRRVLQSIEPVEGMKILIKKISETATNEDFLLSFKQEAEA